MTIRFKIKPRAAHCAGHFITKKEVLVPNHVEDCKERWDGVHQCHCQDGNEDRSPPTWLEEVDLVYPNYSDHHDHASHLEELCLQDLDLSPDTPDQGPCSGGKLAQELRDEGVEQDACEAFALDKTPKFWQSLGLRPSGHWWQNRCLRLSYIWCKPWTRVVRLLRPRVSSLQSPHRQASKSSPHGFGRMAARPSWTRRHTCCFTCIFRVISRCDCATYPSVCLSACLSFFLSCILSLCHGCLSPPSPVCYLSN